MIETIVGIGITALIAILFIILLLASSDSQPTFMHCRERRAKSGTPGKHKR